MFNSVETQNMEIDQLLQAYCASRSPQLRNQLLERNLPLAASVARRFAGRGVDYDDLFQIASLALLKSLERYDCGKGRFISFAIPSVVGEVKNFFRDRSRLMRMPRRSGELILRIEKTRAELDQRLSRSPTSQEIADELNISVEQLLEALETRSAVNTSSLEAGVGDEEDGSPLEALLGLNEAGFERVETRDLIERGLNQLPELERRVIEARFYNNLSQRETAQRLGVSQMSISRAERRALELFRRLIGEDEDQTLH